MVDAVFNGLLAGSSSYALCMVKPIENPFIFTACAVGLCHSLIGLYGNIMEGTSNSKEAAPASADAPATSDKIVQKIHSITHSCMEIISVPLINIDLYTNSQQSSALAMGHSLFIIPLAFELTMKLFDFETDATSAETLKELTTLGNIVSLIFLSVNENNLPCGIMALSSLFAQYGSVLMESLLKGSGENAWLAGYSLFLALVPTAISSAGEST